MSAHNVAPHAVLTNIFSFLNLGELDSVVSEHPEFDDVYRDIYSTVQQNTERALVLDHLESTMGNVGFKQGVDTSSEVLQQVSFAHGFAQGALDSYKAGIARGCVTASVLVNEEPSIDDQLSCFLSNCFKDVCLDESSYLTLLQKYSTDAKELLTHLYATYTSKPRMPDKDNCPYALHFVENLDDLALYFDSLFSKPYQYAEISQYFLEYAVEKSYTQKSVRPLLEEKLRANILEHISNCETLRAKVLALGYVEESQLPLQPDSVDQYINTTDVPSVDVEGGDFM